MSVIGRIGPVTARMVTPVEPVTPFPRRSTEPLGAARILDDVHYTVSEPVEAAPLPRDSYRARTVYDAAPPRGATPRAGDGRTASQLAALRAYLPQPDYRGLYIDVRV